VPQFDSSTAYTALDPLAVFEQFEHWPIHGV